MRRPVRRITLSQKLWILLTIPIAVFLGVYDVMAEVVRREQLLDEASLELRNQAAVMEMALEGAVIRQELPHLRERIERLGQFERVRGVAAFDHTGAAVAMTEQLLPVAPALRSIALRALASKTDIEEQRLLNGVPTLVRTVTFSDDDHRPAAVAILVRDLRYLQRLRYTLMFALALTTVALFVVLMGVLMLALRTTVGRPVSAIVSGVMRVTEGKLEIEVPERGAHEIVLLSEAFNAMTRSLRDARAVAQQEERARLEVEQKLRQAQALAAVGQVTTSIAHEIGSPLNVVLGRARRAADRADCPPEFHAEFVTIADQSERISRAVSRVLAVARPSDGTAQSCLLTKVIVETLAFIGPECRQRRIRVRFEPEGALPHVALDLDRTFQIVFNLCLNATQAQTNGGDLLVRILSNENRLESPVVFEVEDSGPGVPKSAEEHIFEPFFTTKSSQGGSGLGLAIVSGIVRDAGGTVELRGSALGGACFRVTLPRAEPSSAEPSGAEPSSTEAAETQT